MNESWGNFIDWTSLHWDDRRHLRPMFKTLARLKLAKWIPPHRGGEREWPILLNGKWVIDYET